MGAQDRQDGVDGPRERILVVCTRYIGDTVLAIPFLRNLRRAHPDAVIEVFAERAARAVLAACPYHDELVAWERPRQGWRASAASMWTTALAPRPALRACLSAQAIDVGALLAWLAGIPRRVGFACEGCRLLLTRAVAVRPGRHQVQAYLDQLRADGVSIDDGRNENWVSAAAAARADRLLEPLPPDRPRVFLAVRGTDALRFWPADRWVRLVEWLVRDRGCEIVLCGGPADAKAHESLGAAVGANVRGHLHDFSAAVPLQDIGGLVARMDLCIGVDTGLIHLAASFGVPVVVLVGPTDPNQWAPWMTLSEVVRSPRVVRSLRDRLRRHGVAAAAGLRWPLGRASMDDIGVAEVMERVDRLLPSGTAAPHLKPTVVRTIDFRDGGFTYAVVSLPAAAVPATKPLAHAH